MASRPWGASPVTIWDPTQYLRFADERARPFAELVGRITTSPRSVVDLGCGAGNATAGLLEHWPSARVLGIDSSPEMIATASGLAGPRLAFAVGDVRTWTPDDSPDVVVSNAVLHWVPSHEALLGRWADWLAPGGSLAFQVPGNFDEPSHTELRRLTSSGRWTLPEDELLVERPILEPSAYLDLLAGLGLDADVWETTYLQVLTGPDAVLEWVRGTALRPVLSALDPEAAAEFTAEYRNALRAAYPMRADGRTVMPFRRVFAVGRRR